MRNQKQQYTRCMVDSSGTKEALEALEDAAVQSTQWLLVRDDRIVAARNLGATWEQISTAAKMSRQGVINVVNRASGG